MAHGNVNGKPCGGRIKQRRTCVVGGVDICTKNDKEQMATCEAANEAGEPLSVCPGE